MKSTDGLPISKSFFQMEDARSFILNLGYDYVVLKSKVKKTMNRMRRRTQNNMYHYIEV